MYAKMSVIGLFNYDNSLFDVFSLPEEVDRDIVIDSIFEEAGEMTVKYPDANIFKRFLSSWSRRKLSLWERYLEVIKARYELTYNYDRYETETISRDLDRTEQQTHTGTQSTQNSGTDTLTMAGKETVSHTGTQATTDTGTDATAHTGTVSNETVTEARTDYTGTQTETPGETETRNVNAYNASTLVAAEQNVKSGQNSTARNLTDSTDSTVTDTQTFNDTQTRTANLTNTRTDQLQDVTTFGTGDEARKDTHAISQTETRTDNLTDAGTGTETEDTTRTVRAYGNIGVTTAQQMLQQELDLLPALDIYQIITADFVDHFCVGIY